jgi:SnoaL-like domain
MEHDLETLLERQRIVDAVTELFVATDRRDWPAVIACFAPQVTFDMRSMTGAPETTVASSEIAAGWERGLAPLAAVHHQAGNFQVRVEGDTAEASCYAIASHYLPNPSGRNTRTFVGSYDLGLRKDAGRWRITRFRFHLKYVDGNAELERSAAAPPPPR